MAEFTVKWLKGVETRDWMSFRPTLKKAILTNDLDMRHLVDILVNFFWCVAIDGLLFEGDGTERWGR